MGDFQAVTPVVVLQQGRIGYRATLGRDLDFWVMTGLAIREAVLGRDLDF